MRYVIDVHTNQTCNLRCSYCALSFDAPPIKHLSDELMSKSIDSIKAMLNSPEFSARYNMIQISFFGGESTQYFKSIKTFCDAFDNDPRICFFLYSNGFKYSKAVWEHLEKYVDKFVFDGNQPVPKFLTQISYDGLASHDVDRLDAHSRKTALDVKETIFKMHEKRIPYEVHPTLAAKNFDKIALNYLEFKKMRALGMFIGPYNPTIDYLTKFSFNAAELKVIKETLKIEFKKILKPMVAHYKEHGYFDFGWFNDQKAICCAGNGYTAIDLDGSILPCHGNFESEKKDELRIARLGDDGFVDTLLKSTDKYAQTLQHIPEECINCYSHLCWKCNAAKYEISGNWTDYTNQPGLCEIFKFISRYRIALLENLSFL